MKATDHDKTVLSSLKKSPIGRGNLRAVETPSPLQGSWHAASVRAGLPCRA